MLSRDVMNECAHAWIAVALPMLVVRVDIVGVLADAYEPSPVEERDFALHQGLRPFDTIHLLERCWPCGVPATGRSSEHRQVFSSVD